MKMIKFIVACLCISTVVISCASMKEINTSNVQLGMTKTEVRNILGKKPDNIVAAKSYNNGNLEAVQYSQYYDGYSDVDSARGAYYFYFFNDKLVKWEPRPRRKDNALGYDFLDNVYYSLNQR